MESHCSIRPTTDVTSDTCGVRLSWMHDVAQRCQVLLAQVCDGPSLTSAALEAWIGDLPEAEGRFEGIVLQGLLFEIALACEPPDDRSRSKRRADALTRAIFDAASRKSRTRSPADRAARMIREGGRGDLRVKAIAQAVGCHESALRREFRRTFGMTMREYHVRVRVAAALMEFAGGAEKVSTVSRLVGYRSAKNFHRAVREVTGYTPGRLARMPTIALAAHASRLAAPGWGESG